VSAELPPPSPEAREHSARVTAAVRDAIAQAGGFLSLERYLSLVLYAPGLGYYAAGARKFGADGDFVTAPEMTPLFAQTLATPVATLLAASDGRELVELGAGTGALAADLLAALAAAHALPARYRILEVSAELRERQQATLARRAPDALARVEWIATLPNVIDGAVIANEVLDAVPPHAIARRGGVWFERGVVVADEFSDEFPGGLRAAERPLADARLRALGEARFPDDGDYASEVAPAAEALVESLARRVRSGGMLFIDYGFPQHEFYHPQRADGTLAGHYRHRVHHDPLLWPGLSDLTAHVDFTAMALAGERGGLAVAGYGPLAAFLVGAGILERLAACGEPATPAYLAQAAAVQRLLSPTEMGESFKVLALTRGDAIAWPYFGAADRTHRL
jgi:SAM-dependent MidA family methyltransferase